MDKQRREYALKKIQEKKEHGRSIRRTMIE